MDAEVAHFMAKIAQQGFDFFLILEARMIGRHGDFHFRHLKGKGMEARRFCAPMFLPGRFTANLELQTLDAYWDYELSGHSLARQLLECGNGVCGVAALSWDGRGLGEPRSWERCQKR